MPFSLSVFCQNDTVFIERNINFNNPKYPKYEQDTIVFESPYYRHVLIGTSVVNSLENYRAMNIYGFDFYKIESISCNSNDIELGSKTNSIQSIYKNDSSLLAEISVYDNCGYSFLCEIEIANDSTLNFIAKGYGHFFSCNCCHTLKYYIKLNKECDIEKTKYFIINGEEKTRKSITKLN